MHFDATISLGNILAFIGFVIMAIGALRAYSKSEADLKWRISNLETWRKEHMVDAHARDTLIRRLDKLLEVTRWQVREMARTSNIHVPAKLFEDEKNET